MSFLKLSTDEVTLIILGISIIPIVILMVFAIVVAIRRGRKLGLERKQEVEANVDDSQKILFYNVYGGADNIKSVTKELSRISVIVYNIEKVNAEELKDLGANGILLVNDVVKCSFGDRAPYIYNILNEKAGKYE